MGVNNKRLQVLADPRAPTAEKQHWLVADLIQHFNNEILKFPSVFRGIFLSGCSSAASEIQDNLLQYVLPSVWCAGYTSDVAWSPSFFQEIHFWKMALLDPSEQPQNFLQIEVFRKSVAKRTAEEVQFVFEDSKLHQQLDKKCRTDATQEVPKRKFSIWGLWHIPWELKNEMFMKSGGGLNMLSSLILDYCILSTFEEMLDEQKKHMGVLPTQVYSYAMHHLQQGKLPADLEEEEDGILAIPKSYNPFESSTLSCLTLVCFLSEMSHFVSCCISLKHKSIAVLDSIRKPKTTRLVGNVCKYILHTLLVKKKKISNDDAVALVSKFEIFDVLEMPQQSDAINCGRFTLFATQQCMKAGEEVLFNAFENKNWSAVLNLPQPFEEKEFVYNVQMCIDSILS